MGPASQATPAFVVNAKRFAVIVVHRALANEAGPIRRELHIAANERRKGLLLHKAMILSQ